MHPEKKISLTAATGLAEQLVQAAANYPYACVLLSNSLAGSEEQILAGYASAAALDEKEPGQSFARLRRLLDHSPGWYFGHLSYDLKNETEDLVSSRPELHGFGAMRFFSPELLVCVDDRGEMKISPPGAALPKKNEPVPSPVLNSKFVIRQQTSREEYIATSKKLMAHIHRGDIYEINYCIGFYAENVKLDPPALFLRLNKLAAAPFSALYRNGDSWLICASPERFLQKKANCIISQPIKGTRPRGKTEAEDRALAEELRNDPKEQSENVMIVDLVRNDLSKVAKRGSVMVDELFGIHSFKTVHQMISTVIAELREDVHPADAVKAAFPMGSMTGAPKVRAMQLAEEHEQMRRGLYSGAVGYFTPEGDFDFNVVIRSILYNAATGYLSLMVGSALTAAADPEKEYEECLLKARGLFEALGVSGF